MKDQWGSLGRTRQGILERISNRLSREASVRHRQDIKLLAIRAATAMLDDVQEELERRRALRAPAPWNHRQLHKLA